MPALSIVVPTFRERDNVGELVSRLHGVLDAVADWEVVFVDDDSPDGTWQEVELLARDISALKAFTRGRLRTIRMVRSRRSTRIVS